MPGWTRGAIEALTYNEAIGVLAEYDWQEQDRRIWLLSQKSDEPVETYDKIRERLEQSMAPAEPIAPNWRPWYMNN